MTYAEALERYGLPGKQVDREAWDEAQARYPAGGPAFLLDNVLNQAMDYANTMPEVRTVILDAAKDIRRDEGLSRLAWACSERMFGMKTSHDWGLSFIMPKLGSLGDLFPVIVLMSGMAKCREEHRKRGIPADVVRATLDDINLWLRHQKATRGRYGLLHLSWLSFHAKGLLYRLGRLQFMRKGCYGDVRLYREKATGKLLMMRGPGTVLRSDGCVDGTNGIHDEEGRWTTVFEETKGEVRGTAIAERARPIREPVTLKKAEWDLLIGPDDPIFDVHIPAEEPLTDTAALDSFRRAPEFFGKHYPEHKGRGFQCDTWLFDPLWEDLLGSKSNVVKFLKMFYIYPSQGWEGTVFTRIYDDNKADPRKMPRDTGMRRAVAEFYDKGGRLTGNAGGLRPVSGLS